MEKKLIVILLCVIRFVICNTGQGDKPVVQFNQNIYVVNPIYVHEWNEQGILLVHLHADSQIGMPKTW